MKYTYFYSNFQDTLYKELNFLINSMTLENLFISTIFFMVVANFHTTVYKCSYECIQCHAFVKQQINVQFIYDKGIAYYLISNYPLSCIPKQKQ